MPTIPPRASGDTTPAPAPDDDLLADFARDIAPLLDRIDEEVRGLRLLVASMLREAGRR